MLKGLDLSHWQLLPVTSLIGKVDFVFLKGSQGKTYQDPTFDSQWKALKAKTSLQRGAYHFLSIYGTAQEQADNFLSLGVNWKDPLCMPPVLDVEIQVGPNQAETDQMNKWIMNNKQTFINLITDWINIVEKATGRKVIIYSYKSFFHEYLADKSWPNNPIWLASYQKNEPGLPAGYGHYQFWQYSDHGKLTGETSGGELDLDYFNGTLQQLDAL